MTSHKTWLHHMWRFSFSSIYIISFDLFESIHLIVRSMPEIFDISIDEQAFSFLGIIHFLLRCFPFFLVTYKLLQLIISFHLEIYIYWALKKKQ